jgi:toxin CcdB
LHNGERFNMTRFDVFRNSGKGQAVAPFLLDVQSNHIGALGSRVVIPLRRLDCFPKVLLPLDLTPIFEIEGVACILDTPQLAAIPRDELKTVIISLAHEQATIIASLDRLFGAF